MVNLVDINQNIIRNEKGNIAVRSSGVTAFCFV